MIESVTPQQIKQIVERMLESKPSVGAFGDLKNVPGYEVFQCVASCLNLNCFVIFLMEGN